MEFIISNILIPAVASVVSFAASYSLVKYRLLQVERDLGAQEDKMDSKHRELREEIKAELKVHKKDISDNTLAIWNKIDKFEDKFNKILEMIGEIKGILKKD